MFDVHETLAAEQRMARMIAGVIPKNFGELSIKVPCPLCGRQPGERCKKSWHKFSAAHRLPHKERVALAILAYE